MLILRKRKFKILLIQLPFPYFPIRKHWGNIPLAAGYLKAATYKEGLLNEVEIEILDERHTNLSSDAQLIDLIISKSPDILGFSLYNWNSIRSLFIAEEVKKKLPNLKIIAGGTEVTLDTKYILNNRVVDIGCLGEGELTFVEIIKSIINGQDDYKNIKGIFFRKNGKIIITPHREPIKELDQIPSPYILGFINPKDYGEAWLENMRGCPFRCSYCAFGMRTPGYFSAERIGEELKVIQRSGISFIRFINSSFTLGPNFYKICEKIKKVNIDNRLSFFGFTSAEDINEEVADLLKECNFYGLEIGLQSVNPSTLEAINRKANLRKFIRGLKFIRERKINFSINIIIGLPNETLKDFKRTLRFLRDNRCYNITSLVLFILPGTKLRKEAKKYGIKYQNKPPYLTTETLYMSNSEIKEAITLVKRKPKPTFEGTLISYCNIKYPLLHEKDLGNFFKFRQLSNHINKVILELDSCCQNVDQLEELGKRLSRIISQPFTAWFKSQNIDKDFVFMKSFLLPIANSNPFLLWSIILETDNNFSLPLIERLKRKIPSKEKLFDFCQTSDAISICVIFSWKDNKKNKLWLKEVSRIIPFYWSLDISNDYNWRNEVNNILREKNSVGILVDFDLKSKLDFVINASKFIYKKAKIQHRNISFRNLAFDYLVNKSEYIESVLSLDKNMDILSIVRAGNKTVFDLIEYRLRFQNILKEQK